MISEQYTMTTIILRISGPNEVYVLDQATLDLVIDVVKHSSEFEALREEREKYDMEIEKLVNLKGVLA